MIEEMENQQPETGCCPRFDPQPWENQIFTWENRQFIKDRVFTFLYMPVNFGSVIKRMMRLVDSAKAQTPNYLCLSDHISKWNMDIFLAVDQEIPGAQNITFSGKYFSRVYEGNFRDTGKWCADFEKNTKDQGMLIKKWYMWYTTCPKCAKAYGKNYVVILGEIS